MRVVTPPAAADTRSIKRAVVSVRSVVPGLPNHRWCSIELELECGHTRPVLRHNACGELSRREAWAWLGHSLPCAKCATVSWVRRKQEMKLRRSGAVPQPSPSRDPGPRSVE